MIVNVCCATDYCNDNRTSKARSLTFVECVLKDVWVERRSVFVDLRDLN